MGDEEGGGGPWCRPSGGRVPGIHGGSRTVLPGGTAVPGRIPAGVPTIKHRRLCYSGEWSKTWFID